jgi:uncharacterized protein (TIGR02001 family)
MRTSLKLLTTTLLAGVACGAAQAETSVTANIGYTNDYIYRGLSQKPDNGSFQGGVDLTNGIFYAGTWLSSIDFGTDSTIEYDFYAGVTPSVGNTTFNLGVIYYGYDGDDAVADDLPYWEALAGFTHAFDNGYSFGGKLMLSPEFTLNSGTAVYTEVNAATKLAEYGNGLTVTGSGAVGYQTVEDNDAFGFDNYTTWNAGLTAAYDVFSFDLRYHDTDIDASALADGKLVGLVKLTVPIYPRGE